MAIKEERIDEVIAVYKTNYQMDLAHDEACGILHRLILMFQKLAEHPAERANRDPDQHAVGDDMASFFASVARAASSACLDGTIRCHAKNRCL